MKLQESKRRSSTPRAAELVRPPEQAETSWFDPEVEFTAEDKDHLVAEILNEKTRNRLYYSFHALTLFPELANNLHLEELRADFLYAVENDEWELSRFEEMMCRAVFSDYEAESFYPPHRGGVFEIPDRAACMLTDKRNAEEDRQWLKEEFRRMYKKWSDALVQVRFDSLNPQLQNGLAWFRIALPEEFDQRVAITETEGLLRGFRRELEGARARRREWKGVLWRAFQLAALSAQDIEYTATGQLKFIQHRKAMTQGPKLPDRPEV